MTKKAQRIAIAATAGIEDCGERDGCFRYSDGQGKNYAHWTTLPDYTASLDAIIPVVRAMPEEARATVLAFLERIAGPVSVRMLATSEKWSECYLRAIGQWDDSK